MHYEAQLWVSPTDASQAELLTTVIDVQLNKLQSGTHRRPAQELSDFSMFMARVHSTSLLLCPFSACDRLTSPSYGVSSKAAQAL